MTTERCARCKSVIWAGYYHGCVGAPAVTQVRVCQRCRRCVCTCTAPDYHDSDLYPPGPSVEMATTTGGRMPGVAFFPPVSHPAAWRDVKPENKA